MKALIITLIFSMALVLQAGATQGPVAPASPEMINALIPVEEEAYVDDIPFSTAGIAFMHRKCCLPVQAEEEANDIPFNTAEIAARARIPMEQEQQVPDMFSHLCFHPVRLAGCGHTSDVLLEMQIAVSELRGLAYELFEINEHRSVITPEALGEMIFRLNRVIEAEVRFVKDDLGMNTVF